MLKNIGLGLIWGVQSTLLQRLLDRALVSLVLDLPRSNFPGHSRNTITQALLSPLQIDSLLEQSLVIRPALLSVPDSLDHAIALVNCVVHQLVHSVLHLDYELARLDELSDR